LAQATVTPVTAPAPTVPLPLLTTQLCAGDAGCVATVTAYGAPLAIGVANVKAPLAVMVLLSPPLLRSTRPVPVRPLTLPLTVYRFVTQLTASVTGPPATAPAGDTTVHVCDGAVGCDSTVTA